MSDIKDLKGIGEKTAALFHKVGVFSYDDLLHYYPHDYIRYPQIKQVSELAAPEKAALCLTILREPALLHVRGKTILSVIAGDQSGALTLSWFNMPYLKKNLKAGMKRIFYGSVQAKGDSLKMLQPRLFEKPDYDRVQKSLQPVYPLTKGLTGNTVQKAVKQVLSDGSKTEDYLTEKEREELQLWELEKSIRSMHEPADFEELKKARERLVFDEFFFFIRSVRRLKDQKERAENAYPMIETAECARLIESLPYSLTGAQERAYRDILRDLSGDTAMNRLIQGDVGSGKTVVALLAMVNTVKNGFQAAMMAPTEVLAAQHMKKISETVRALGIRCILLTGSLTAKEKREARERIASGEADIVIGTHALITDTVEFSRLALVITDEQHRFGVRQRELLSGKSGKGMPHILVMSATPIPRTLAIILYGDLDISVMDEVPASRLPVKNCVVGEGYRKKAYEFILQEVQKGHQAYLICTQVEEGEGESERENVLDTGRDLQEYFGEKLRVGILHGGMKPKDKDRIMTDFAEGRIDLLVSTTVVEVGVDVPNATVMMIENAECFGLSQLHQLRGRIGRGSEQSYCIFIDTSRERRQEKKPNERLLVMNETNDGFKIASEDLKLRGPGDVFGIRQSGDFSFRLGDVFKDAALLKKASDFAAETEGNPEKEELYSKYDRMPGNVSL